MRVIRSGMPAFMLTRAERKLNRRASIGDCDSFIEQRAAVIYYRMDCAARREQSLLNQLEQRGGQIPLKCRLARLEPFLDPAQWDKRGRSVVDVRCMSNERMIPNVQPTGLVCVASFRDDGRRDNQAILRIRISQHEEQVQPHSSIANEKCRARPYEVHDAAKLAGELR